MARIGLVKVKDDDMPHMYILECADGSYYVGSTFDLDARLEQHWLGSASSYTQKRRPFKLVFAEEFETVVEAFDAEMKVKRWSRAKKLALIEQRWDDLRQLAKKPKRQRADEERKTPPTPG